MRILLITPNFFEYPQVICEEIRSMGHEVDWFDDRPSTKGIVKAVIRIQKNLIAIFIAKYFKKILSFVKTKRYDKVLLISGQSLSFNERMILALKQAQPQAEFILYQWDSINNFKYIESLQKHFDRCYSFDRNDVKNNSRLKFLPLFYSKRYEVIGAKKVESFDYDFMFVGTAHPKKFKYVNEMAEKLHSVFKKQFIYFFFPSLLVYIYRKLKNPELKKARLSDFHFTALNSSQMDELLTRSKCVLDSAQAGQIGLTIRVLETLGAKRKLITTNEDIVNYDFYRPENVYVYKGKFDHNSPFFTSPYINIDQCIYEKYSLKNWLSTLLGI